MRLSVLFVCFFVFTYATFFINDIKYLQSESTLQLFRLLKKLFRRDFGVRLRDKRNDEVFGLFSLKSVI